MGRLCWRHRCPTLVGARALPVETLEARLDFAMTCSLPILLVALLPAAATENPSSKTPLTVQARDPAGQPRRETILLEPSKTAVVVIDVWDRHWCTTYTARVGNLVPRMNKTLDAAENSAASSPGTPNGRK